MKISLPMPDLRGGGAERVAVNLANSFAQYSRSSGFHRSPIHIGEDVWIGCKASVLRCPYIGDRCVIGAHALVKSHIPDDMLAVRVPDRIVKQIVTNK